MKPRVKIATAVTPDGLDMQLFQHDRDFSIIVNGEDLMHSRRHESELELARLGCGNLGGQQGEQVLIGGLGMGYTLRQTLDLLDEQALVVVGELLESVVEWNQEFFGELNGKPLGDKRVTVVLGDVLELISSAKDKYDVILLDVDNGPDAMTYGGNQRLYGYEGITACRRALRKHGCLAIWSAKPSKDFEQLLVSCGFHVCRYRVAAHKGKNSSSHFIWVAAGKKSLLPDGGSEPRLPKMQSGGRRKKT